MTVSDSQAPKNIHFSSENEHWCTPRSVLDPIWEFNDMERIGLDPCSNENSIVHAKTEWTEGGLEREWCGHGLVYVNPPYGRSKTKQWLWKILNDGQEGTEIVALVPARTDTLGFQACFCVAKAICFWKGRITFKGAPHGAPFPSALLYFGSRGDKFLKIFDKFGYVVVR